MVKVKRRNSWKDQHQMPRAKWSSKKIKLGSKYWRRADLSNYMAEVQIAIGILNPMLCKQRLQVGMCKVPPQWGVAKRNCRGIANWRCIATFGCRCQLQADIARGFPRCNCGVRLQMLAAKWDWMVRVWMCVARLKCKNELQKAVAMRNMQETIAEWNCKARLQSEVAKRGYMLRCAIAERHCKVQLQAGLQNNLQKTIAKKHCGELKIVLGVESAFTIWISNLAGIIQVVNEWVAKHNLRVGLRRSFRSLFQGTIAEVISRSNRKGAVARCSWAARSGGPPVDHPTWAARSAGPPVDHPTGGLGDAKVQR